MNNYYSPDKWMIVRINGANPHYRVFGSWYGGYARGDSWRMNSGIVSMIEEEHRYLFIGTSGSTYACHKDTYGASSYGSAIALRYENEGQLQILDEVDARTLVNAADWNAK